MQACQLGARYDRAHNPILKNNCDECPIPVRVVQRRVWGRGQLVVPVGAYAASTAVCARAVDQYAHVSEVAIREASRACVVWPRLWLTLCPQRWRKTFLLEPTCSRYVRRTCTFVVLSGRVSQYHRPEHCSLAAVLFKQFCTWCLPEALASRNVTLAARWVGKETQGS